MKDNYDSIIKQLPSHIINGVTILADNGTDVKSINPYSGEQIWSCSNASSTQVNEAVQSAVNAFPSWAALPSDERIEKLRKFIDVATSEKDILTYLVSLESGKPEWEASAEVNSLIGKLDVSIDAYKERNAVSSRNIKGKTSITKFRPHGVMAVLGPFNFPLTMANGNIMPALVAGNTVVFKPSEFTPLSGVYMAKMWQDCGLPNGVLNCVNGNGTVGKQLVEHSDVDGVLFIGSHETGISILDSQGTNPSKIIALEMGGNSPLAVEDYSSNQLNAVVNIIIQSSFVTSGQRCSSARRILVNRKNKGLVDSLVRVAGNIKIGSAEDSDVFYGPMIRPEAAQQVLNRFDELVSGGGKVLLAPKLSGPYKTLLSPGIIDVTNCANDRDEEIFGPIVKVIFYDTLADAISISNDTKFGLAAGIVTQDKEKYDQYYQGVKAGIVNWNQQLTGATKFAPFGGVKGSGNYRPAGYLAADYCSYAVASFEVDPAYISNDSSPGITF
jgi:succinylglutamic semialdehyde dehydrogenase